MSFTLLLLLCAQDVPLASERVPDAVLAAQRGGFALPNGMDVALSVQTQTSLNGAVVLSTVFRVDHGAPTIGVYVPKVGETVAAPAASRATTTAAGPAVTVDGRTGITVIPAAGIVAVSTRAGTSDPVAAGLFQVDEGSVTTDTGVVTRAVRGGQQTIELRADDLTITHLAGSAIGSAIVNSGSDRAIDTQTTVSINVANATPALLASAALRVEDVANDALAMRR